MYQALSLLLLRAWERGYYVTNHPNRYTQLITNIIGILIVAGFCEAASRHCCLSPSIAAAAPETAKVSYWYIHSAHRLVVG